jgi:hypothetical protein
MSTSTTKKQHVPFTEAKKALTEEQFLTAANGKANVRTFLPGDYDAYLQALRDARKAAKKVEPFYATGDTGGVANAYKYMTETAQWAVWVAPDTHAVIHAVLRVRIHGRNVPCPFYGGERGYLASWRKANSV